jgi:formate dehydrogenase subunit gamma
MQQTFDDIVTQFRRQKADSKGFLPNYLLLNFLHELQEKFGYVPKSFHKSIADLFRISQADLLGMMGFYDFFDEISIPVTLDVCVAESCQAQGVNQYLTGLEELEKQGFFRLRRVYCLGNCAAGPSGLVRTGKKTIPLSNITIASVKRVVHQKMASV